MIQYHNTEYRTLVFSIFAGRPFACIESIIIKHDDDNLKVCVALSDIFNKILCN